MGNLELGTEHMVGRIHCWLVFYLALCTGNMKIHLKYQGQIENSIFFRNKPNPTTNPSNINQKSTINQPENIKPA